MLMRPFGQTGVAISILGLGCSRIGSFNNPVPMAEIRRLLERALEIGVTVFDTADIYGQGDSETEIGRLLKGRRERGFVVTKVGKTFSTKMRLLRPFKPLLKPLYALKKGGAAAVTAQREANIGSDFSGAHVTAALHDSLRRLCFESVDALLLHSPSAAQAASPDVARALAALKAAGKVRHFGLSCDDVETVKVALAVPGVEMLELPFNVIDAISGTQMLDAILSRRIGVLAREVVTLQPNLSPDAAIARASGMHGVTSVIVGTSRIAHLEGAVTAVGSCTRSDSALRNGQCIAGSNKGLVAE